MQSFPNQSAIVAITINLTAAQVWQSQKRKPNRNSIGTNHTRPTLLANDIDRAFNCVMHYRLIDKLSHYCFVELLIPRIEHFNQN